MRLAGIRVVLAFALALGGGSAFAQSTLRIALADDPDVLDPTLSRSYTTRIVFASICDKLFDIDENLKIVPQLALGYGTSADGKALTIKLRPGVKFHDGEPMDAAAVKYSLDRHVTMKGSYRRAEIGAISSVDVVDPLTIRINLTAPFSPLPAQLTDRAGMMVSPKATNSSSGCSRTGSWSRDSPTTGTRISSSSTRSPIGRSSMRQCDWPTCARAAST